MAFVRFIWRYRQGRSPPRTRVCCSRFGLEIEEMTRYGTCTKPWPFVRISPHSPKAGVVPSKRSFNSNPHVLHARKRSLAFPCSRIDTFSWT